MKSTPTPGFLPLTQGIVQKKGNQKKPKKNPAEGQRAVRSLVSKETRHRNKQTEAKKHPSAAMGRGWTLDTGDQHWAERPGEGERAEPPNGSEEEGKHVIITS